MVFLVNSSFGGDLLWKTILIKQKTQILIILFVHDETMLKDKRRQITLYVPKDMIGLIIGKGGSKIKEFGKKYNKFFKVEQDPAEKKRDQLRELNDKISHIIYNDETKNPMEQINEIVGASEWLSSQERDNLLKDSSEKLTSYEAYRKEQEVERHKNGVFHLKMKLYDYFGENLADQNNQQIDEGIANYLQQNKETISVIPTVEELNKIRDEFRDARDLNVKQREAQKQEEIRKMNDAVHRFIDNAEQDGKKAEAPAVEQYIKENFADSAYMQTVLEAG